VDMREPKMPAPRARRKAMKQSPAPIGCRTMTYVRAFAVSEPALEKSVPATALEGS
jgi:hypothetical protein